MRRATSILSAVILLAGCSGRPEEKVYVGQVYAEAQRAARAAGYTVGNAEALTGTAEPEGFSLRLPEDRVLLVFRQGERVAVIQQVAHASRGGGKERSSVTLEVFRLRP